MLCKLPREEVRFSREGTLAEKRVPPPVKILHALVEEELKELYTKYIFCKQNKI